MTTNYIAEVADRLAGELPGCDSDLLRLYTLLAFVKGPDTTLEDVHDAWAIWRAAIRPDHRSIVPFHQLAPEVQQLDTKYADAIRRVATS